mgnify:CR=1 FL=1
MAKRYLCPVCRGNRSRFEIVYKLVQEVQKDELTGEVLFRSDELVTRLVGGRPDVDVRCARCGYTGSEASFARAAEREGPPAAVARTPTRRRA